MQNRPHITIIGQGFVGSAYKSFLQERAHVTVWDCTYSEDYPTEEIARSQLAMICVGTPRLKTGACDVSAVRKALKDLPQGPLVSIRSTVPPGTTKTLTEEFQRSITFAPEYIGETGSNHAWGSNIDKVPHFILGGDAESRRSTLRVLKPILPKAIRIFECSSTEAEVIKLMENAFLATKVAFVNELYDYSQALGCDWQKVRGGWLQDPRIGLSHTKVFPNSRGFSGSCLPKDLSSLIHEMKTLKIDPIMMCGVRDSNRRIRNEHYTDE